MQPRPPRRHLPTWAALVGLGALALVAGSIAPSVATHPQGEDVATTVSSKVPSATHRARAAGTTTDPASTIRITQANLKSGDAVARFQSDVATVLKGQPDFITYNEVPWRQDAVLAPPPGYALWRTPGQYKGETPVAWRADKWTNVAQGTQMLSNKAGRLPGQHVDWGIRYANWVTLQSLDGRTISVVSAHLAPVISITKGLQPKEVRRLGALVNTLAAAGPVLIGGDFNMPYTGSSYLRSLFDTFGMVPSYDALGAHFPTGDHHGATIDYLFLRQDPVAPMLAFDRQKATELYSDHDAVTADLSWLTPAPTSGFRVVPGRVVNRPNGTGVQQRAVLRTLVQAVNHAPAGAAVHLTTTWLSAPALVRALDRAVDRGVHVQLILRSRTKTPIVDHFQALLGHRASAPSFAIRCRSACRTYAKHHTLPRTDLLVSAVVNTPAVWIRSDRDPTISANKRPTVAHVSISKSAYDRAFQRFFHLAGRPV